MRKGIIFNTVFFCALVVALVPALAQENVAPVNYNPILQHNGTAHTALHKTTAVSLPFFDDFSGAGIYPDATKWADSEVYINNTMCVNPKTKGVATFDALNKIGLPYDTLSNSSYEFADSLTSQPIDMSANTPADSVYLSFFYQPQGNGFFPLPQDSFAVYLRKNFGDWQKVWVIPGSQLQPFQQVMVPITDTLFFYGAFQFRFVNIAAFNYSDAVWNIDYVYLNSGRNMYDTLVNDIAWNSEPSFYLNDYTSMPYRQFLANPAGERASQFTANIRNNYSGSQTINYKYDARELVSNTPLYTGATTNATLDAYQTLQATFPTYTTTVPIAGPYDQVVFENKCYIETGLTSDPAQNDTLIRQQVFDNYVAYDDGSAERAYYLNQFPTLPAMVAVEYHLDAPDTMQGMAIYFGRQVPLATNKIFSIAVYSALAGVNGATQDVLLYQQDLFLPAYSSIINDFWVYKFDTAVALPAGTFYAGTVQPAASGSDSLYLGLDMNRIGGNHAYYNVLQQWNSSQILGAIMLRPMLGKPLPNLAVTNVQNTARASWNVSPNPAKDNVQFAFGSSKPAQYELFDIAGRRLMQGSIKNNDKLDVSRLIPGMYFVTLSVDGIAGAPQKLLKQ